GVSLPQPGLEERLLARFGQLGKVRLHALVDPTTARWDPRPPRRAETPTRAPPAAAPRISSTAHGRGRKELYPFAPRRFAGAPRERASFSSIAAATKCMRISSCVTQ